MPWARSTAALVSAAVMLSVVPGAALPRGVDEGGTRDDRPRYTDRTNNPTTDGVRAAVVHGMSRFVNTGPHFTVTGSVYHRFDYGISEEVPAHSGTGLYPLTKATGQEICRIFSDNHPIHILCLLFLNFKPAEPEPGAEGRDLTNFSVTFRDAGEAVRLALEVDLRTLPSRNEVFFITSDLPHGKYSNAKARRLLGFEPQDKLEKYWRRKREC